MLLNKTIQIRWNSRNKGLFTSLGYVFTKMGDCFDVIPEHMSNGSNAIVDIECDYCGKHFQKEWYRYVSANQGSHIHKDCCNDCKKHKIEETCYSKYGVTTNFLRDDILSKIEETNIERYGSPNVFSSDIIKNRIRDSNMIKYGACSPMQNKDVLDRASKTCMSRYGVPYYVCTQHNRGKDNPRWKGGVAYHRMERSTSNYIEWRFSVYARDQYTCQCCGSKSSSGFPVVLNAHHIMNWKDYPEMRYDTGNGITLCDRCHTKFHVMFGKSHNNKSQLEEFFVKGKKVC